MFEWLNLAVWCEYSVQVMEAIQPATRWQTWLSWAKSKVLWDSINWNLQLQVRWWGGGGGGGGWMGWLWDEYEIWWNQCYEKKSRNLFIVYPWMCSDQPCRTLGGAAPIRVDTLEYFGSLGLDIHELYGMSVSRINFGAIWMQLMCESNMDRNIDSGKSFDFFGAWGKSWLLYNQHTCLPYLGFLRLFSGWFGGEDFQGGPCGYQQEDGMSKSAYAWHHWWTLPRPFFQHLHFVWSFLFIFLKVLLIFFVLGRWNLLSGPKRHETRMKTTEKCQLASDFRQRECHSHVDIEDGIHGSARLWWSTLQGDWKEDQRRYWCWGMAAHGRQRPGKSRAYVILEWNCADYQTYCTEDQHAKQQNHRMAFSFRIRWNQKMQRQESWLIPVWSRSPVALRSELKRAYS